MRSLYACLRLSIWRLEAIIGDPPASTIPEARLPLLHPYPELMTFEAPVGRPAMAWRRARRLIVLARVLGVFGFVGLLVVAREAVRGADVCRVLALVWFFAFGLWAWRLDQRASRIAGRSGPGPGV
jgi:hypothetical protein